MVSWGFKTENWKGLIRIFGAETHSFTMCSLEKENTD